MLVKEIGQSMRGCSYHSGQIRHLQIRICISLLTMHNNLQLLGEAPAFFKTDFAGLVFDTARQTADYNFIFQNQDYRQLIAYVDLEGDKAYRFSWLEFNMNHDKKLALFKLGVQAAYEFIVTGNPSIHLQAFEWMDYKKIREEML